MTLVFGICTASAAFEMVKLKGLWPIMVAKRMDRNRKIWLHWPISVAFYQRIIILHCLIQYQDLFQGTGTDDQTMI